MYIYSLFPLPVYSRTSSSSFKGSIVCLYAYPLLIVNIVNNKVIAVNTKPTTSDVIIKIYSPFPRSLLIYVADRYTPIKFFLTTVLARSVRRHSNSYSHIKACTPEHFCKIPSEYGKNLLRNRLCVNEGVSRCRGMFSLAISQVF